VNVDVSALLTLPNALAFLAQGGAALLVLWLLDQDYDWVQILSPEWRRIAAYVLTFTLAVVFYTFKMALLQEAMPIGWREWLMLVWAVGAPASIGNQLLHGHFSLGKAPASRRLRIDYRVD
jgi:hypothetical protein